MNKSILIMASVFFMFLLVLIIVLLIKSSNNDAINSLEPRELSDKLIKVTTPQDRSVKKEEVRKEGYDLDAKEWRDGNYAYDERTKDFRLVCEKPCPVSKKILDQEFAAIAYSISTLRGLTQSDIDEAYLPFEVHASDDSVCKYGGSNLLAYATVWDNRGLLCFFFDKIEYDRSKFPYSTSVHEVTHLFEYNKIKRNRVIYEGLSTIMESFFLKGSERDSFCWEGNNWYWFQQYSNPNDPYGTGAELFFELCNKYGFDYDDLPALFRQLDKKGTVDEKEFVSIINNIVGADTSHLFRTAGVI